MKSEHWKIFKANLQEESLAREFYREMILYGFDQFNTEKFIKKLEKIKKAKGDVNAGNTIGLAIAVVDKTKLPFENQGLFHITSNKEKYCQFIEDLVKIGVDFHKKYKRGHSAMSIAEDDSVFKKVFSTISLVNNLEKAIPKLKQKRYLKL